MIYIKSFDVERSNKPIRCNLIAGDCGSIDMVSDCFVGTFLPSLHIRKQVKFEICYLEGHCMFFRVGNHYKTIYAENNEELRLLKDIYYIHKSKNNMFIPVSMEKLFKNNIFVSNALVILYNLIKRR